jgi:predicted Zn-dependent peptidase
MRHARVTRRSLAAGLLLGLAAVGAGTAGVRAAFPAEAGRGTRTPGFALSGRATSGAQTGTSPSNFSVPVVYRKLPNGLRVVVSENHAAPVVVVEVMYRIGFRIEPRNRTGFAHLFEHLMFQGSEHVAKFEHVRIVNQNGGVLNGSTRFDHTNYFEVMPSNALELAMWLEADRMRSLKLTPENLKNQQDVVSEEVRVNVLNQPYGAFEWLGLPQKANTNWYNAHNFYGDLTDIEAATLDDVKKFFETYYAPNNAVMVVTGDATSDEVMRLASKHFGGIPSRPLPERPDISEPPQTAEKSVTEKDKLARTPAIAFGYHLPERMTKDFFALSLLDPLLVGDESARMYQALIKENQIASQVSGGFNYGLGNNFDYNGPMLYTFRVDYRPDRKGSDVLQVVDKVINAVQEHGVTEEELRQAKVNFRSSFLENVEGGTIPGFGRADLLAALALYDDNPDRINTILSDLEKVTAAEVQAAARKYLVPSNRTWIDRVPEGGAR